MEAKSESVMQVSFGTANGSGESYDGPWPTGNCVYPRGDALQCLPHGIRSGPRDGNPVHQMWTLFRRSHSRKHYQLHIVYLLCHTTAHALSVDIIGEMIFDKSYVCRKDMNAADQKAMALTVDSLINYETVKYFQAEAHERKRHDSCYAEYEKSALQTLYSLAFLNFGQNLILSTTMAIAMMMTTHGVIEGRLSVGDVVMVNGLLFQV